jgi:excisionase family DNA binding protein
MQTESIQEELLPQAVLLPESLQLISVKSVCKLVNLGPTLVNEEIRSVRLKSVKVGKRRLIRIAAVRDWLELYSAE